MVLRLYEWWFFGLIKSSSDQNPNLFLLTTAGMGEQGVAPVNLAEAFGLCQDVRAM